MYNLKKEGILSQNSKIFERIFNFSKTNKNNSDFSDKKPSPISYNFMGEGFFIIWNF